MAFNKKVVLVTGASSGIGAATAVLFSKEGAKVALVGRNESKLQKVKKECGPESLVIVADICNITNCKLIIEKTIEKFGKLDVLVNNAGIVMASLIHNENALNVFDASMNTNLRAVVSITSAASSHLITSKGNIINVSAAVSLRNSPSMWAFCASKAGLDSFTKSMALHFAPKGVRVNSVNPGPVKTDIASNMGLNKAQSDVVFECAAKLTPLNRIAESYEIADLIVFLASDKARGITGSIVIHDNGAILKDGFLTERAK